MYSKAHICLFSVLLRTESFFVLGKLIWLRGIKTHSHELKQKRILRIHLEIKEIQNYKTSLKRLYKG